MAEYFDPRAIDPYVKAAQESARIKALLEAEKVAADLGNFEIAAAIRRLALRTHRE